MKKVYGAVEAGGTKFVCGAGTGPDDLYTERFDTTTPRETIAAAVEFLKDQTAGQELQAVGIASFGPVDPDKDSETYGYITSTPKPGWPNTDIAGMIGRGLNTPVGFDSDVNGAALGEYRWGAGRHISDFIYMTIGTGIGGGAMSNGRLVHGMVHPEMGHIHIPTRSGDTYKGKCPFHHNRCFEGLASGPAIEERWGSPAMTLKPDHEAWELEAHYISTALVNYICTLSPKRIILGGGVMEQKHLFPRIRREVLETLNGYIQSDLILNNIDDYIVPPLLGHRAGILGAIALAIQETE